jgi:cytochrome c-type biogenesis protein
MLESSVNCLTAFLAGGLSFISPCVLPLIPGYISFISGVSLEKLSKERDPRQWRRVVFSTLLFVFGFSLVFIALGSSASFFGHRLSQNVAFFNKAAGVLIFLFGLHVTGIIRIKALNYEKRLHLGKRHFGPLGALLIGAAFAFGWTPCIGPILGSILTLAANQETAGQGAILLSCYSAGLGIPFMATALFSNFLIGAFGFVKRNFRTVEIISGGLLMLMGILVFFNFLQVASNYLLDIFPSLKIS